MKRYLKAALFLTMVMAMLLTNVTALAADTESGGSGGIYNLEVASGVTAVPQKADGEPATVTDKEINGTAAEFYEDAVRVQVTYSGAVSGNYYLVLALDGEGENVVPTADNIVYIDQDTAADTSVTFTVYPSSLVSGKTYCIYLSSNDGKLTGLTKVASFQYYMPYMLGDANLDGEVNAYDATVVLRHIAKIEMITDEKALLAADVNKANGVDAGDATKILRYIAKIDATLE